VILGGGVAVCLLLSAHRAVIFAISQLSCITYSRTYMLRQIMLKLHSFGVWWIRRTACCVSYRTKSTTSCLDAVGLLVAFLFVVQLVVDSL